MPSEMCLLASEVKPVLVPKTDPPTFLKRTGCPSCAQMIYPMLKHRIIHVPTRYRLLVLHFEYTFVFMKENLELKSHYVLSLIRMLQGHIMF